MKNSYAYKYGELNIAALRLASMVQVLNSRDWKYLESNKEWLAESASNVLDLIDQHNKSFQKN